MSPPRPPRGLEPRLAVALRADRGGEEGGQTSCSSQPVSEWASIFPDGPLAAAVVDRLTYRAHVIVTGSSSYRLRPTERDLTDRGGAERA